MATGITQYTGATGLSTEAQAGRLSKKMLRVGAPKLLMEKAITVTEDQPEGETRIVRWSRYKALPISTATVTEGITPEPALMEREEVSATLDQYIGLVQTTDVLQYFHPDFKTTNAVQRLGEQAAKTMETVRFNTFKAATNKYYANGTARTDVNTAVALDDIRKAERSLSRQLADTFTQIVLSTPDFNTEAILPAYWAYCHPDLRYDISAISGFTSVKDYGHNVKAADGEWGAIGNIRFLLSTIYAPYPSAGGAKGTMISTDGVSADVYPIIIVGRDAWGGVSFKGMNAIKPFIVAPSHTAADPAAQRGFVGWKTFTKNKILNDAWTVVLEVACTELT